MMNNKENKKNNNNFLGKIPNYPLFSLIKIKRKIMMEMKKVINFYPLNKDLMLIKEMKKLRWKIL